MRHLFVTNNLGQNAGQIVTPSSLLPYRSRTRTILMQIFVKTRASRYFLSLSFFPRVKAAFFTNDNAFFLRVSSSNRISIGFETSLENTATNNNNGIIVVAETFDRHKKLCPLDQRDCVHVTLFIHHHHIISDWQNDNLGGGVFGHDR